MKQTMTTHQLTFLSKSVSSDDDSDDEDPLKCLWGEKIEMSLPSDYLSFKLSKHNPNLEPTPTPTIQPDLQKLLTHF